MSSQPRDLTELLREPSDISDFLAALGQEEPNDPRAARRTAVALLEGLDATHAAAVLFTFARKFARMVAEVSDFCRSQNAALVGQIQLDGGTRVLNVSGLDSAWAFAGPAPDFGALDARAGAIAAALEDVASRVSTEALIKRSTETEVTDFGHVLRNSPNAVHRMMWREIEGSTRDVEHAVCGEADLRVLRMAVEAVGETAGALSGVPLSAGVTTVLQDVQQHLPAVLIELERDIHEVDPMAKVTPAIASLADEIQLLTAQLRVLGAEVSEGARVERGFHDFLRTEFWQARWRIYELWLLVRVLKTLEAAGGALQLRGVAANVWRVAYGRALEPVATASFDAGEVDVYYQYWKESDEGADMPDLVVMERNGRAIAVIDPKHGPSYTRAKVQKVLTRYAGLDADLTAIVNYFDMAAYRFEHIRAVVRTWILASEIAPDSNNARRLELHLTEALHARGFNRAPVPIAVIQGESRRRATQTMDLLYWSTVDCEVDEPAGLWRSTRDGTTMPVLAFRQMSGVECVQLEAAPDGKALIMLRKPKVLLIRPGREPHAVAAWEHSFSVPSLGWSANGAFFALPFDDGDRVFDSSGGVVSVPKSLEIVGWHREAQTFYAVRKEGKELAFLGLIDPERGLLWETEIPVRRPQYSFFRREEWLLQFILGSGDPIVQLGELGQYRVRPDGQLEQSAEPLPLSTSPRGRRELSEGPRSMHDRILLRLRDADGTTHPFVRYTSPNGRCDLLPARVRWTLDEEQFAFVPGRYRYAARLYAVRCGERYARAVSLPGQEPEGFAWAWSGLWD
jgi:hypothetical protein